jgi:hypothetical protein
VHTIYDWVTMAVFAGLIILFLQRSTGPEEPSDHIWQYLPPAIGCALANYLGNHDQGLWAGIIVLAAVAYIFQVLKPFR